MKLPQGDGTPCLCYCLLTHNYRTAMSENISIRTEELVVNGEELMAKVKSLVHEGTIRRIIIKNDEGKDMLEIPLTLGIVGAAFLPVLAAVGAIAALAAKWTIVIVKEEIKESAEEIVEENTI